MQDINILFYIQDLLSEDKVHFSDKNKDCYTKQSYQLRHRKSSVQRSSLFMSKIQKEGEWDQQIFKLWMEFFYTDHKIFYKFKFSQ